MRAAGAALSLCWALAGCGASGTSAPDGGLDPLLECDSAAPAVLTPEVWSQVFNPYCKSCHAPGGSAATYGDWSTAENVQTGAVGERSRYAAADGLLKIVDPSAPANSSLLLKMLGGGRSFPGPRGENVGSAMPFGLGRLPDADLTKVRDWICNGARAQ